MNFRKGYKYLHQSTGSVLEPNIIDDGVESLHLAATEPLVGATAQRLTTAVTHCALETRKMGIIIMVLLTILLEFLHLLYQKKYIDLSLYLSKAEN